MGDHFNVRVYNTLEMLIPLNPPSSTTCGKRAIFNVRSPEVQKAILARYVARMLGAAWVVDEDHTCSRPPRRWPWRLREAASTSASHQRPPEHRHEGGLLRPLVAGDDPEERPFTGATCSGTSSPHVFAIHLLETTCRLVPEASPSHETRSSSLVQR